MFRGSLTPGVFGSDPVLDADAEGVFYYLSIKFDEMRLFKSFDRGITLDAPIQVLPFFADKLWMAIDRTAGIGRGNIYSFASHLEHFPRSTDGGATFDALELPATAQTWGTMSVSLDCNANAVHDECEFRGDFDGDRVTTFAAFAGCFTGDSVATTAPGCRLFDLDADNHIDVADFTASSPARRHSAQPPLGNL